MKTVMMEKMARMGTLRVGLDGRVRALSSPGKAATGFLGAGESMYSHDEMKTMSPPGMMRGAIVVPNRIGEMYSKIPVATAVARHLITALASMSMLVDSYF